MIISEGKGDLFAAISNAQAEFTTVAKNATNPHFKSKFAPLDTIIEMIRPILPKHGLAVMQFTDIADAGIVVETVITHSSGQYISGALAMPVVKQDPQGYGSALTYGRRYALAAALGIVSDEDVDVNATDKQKDAVKKTEKISIDQTIVLRDLLNQGRQFTEKIFCAQAKISKLEDLATDRYDGAFKHAQAQIAKEQVVTA